MKVARLLLAVVAPVVLAGSCTRPGAALSERPSSQAAMAEATEAPPAPKSLKGALRPFWPEIEDAARRAKIDPVAWAVTLSMETSGSPAAVGPYGELGLSQYRAGIIKAIGPECVDRWDNPAVNLRCGARWFARVREPFGDHDPRDADLLAMIAYHSGNLVWGAEKALLAGDDPCDWTDRSYCVTWREKRAAEGSGTSEEVAVRGDRRGNPVADRLAARPSRGGGIAD